VPAIEANRCLVLSGGEISPGAGETIDAFADQSSGPVDVDPDEWSWCLADRVDASRRHAHAMAPGDGHECGAVV
jgi:hypothetical protein